ncbi:FAD-dependent oxidoreductase [Streptomyces sp. NPDC088560]|uniref:FAD-dependent oxidoreductase n=1 Tax=Streptomyces sp. NPDC088560 TaxID=3365868 RepID=UPI0038286D46
MATDNIVIVGAGPVGLTAALAFARAGIPVTVLERDDVLNDSPRAAIHHWCALPFLGSLGILEDAIAAGFLGSGLTFRRFATGEHVTMAVDPLVGHVPHPYSLHLGQGDLGRIILDHLSRHPHAQIIWKADFQSLEQDENGVTVRFGTPDGDQELRAGWVIGTDGARSSVRQVLGLDFEGMTWPERFVATNIRYDFRRHGFHDINMVLDPQYGAVVARLDEDDLWRCTFSEDDSLPLESVEERIGVFLDTFLPDRSGYELVHYGPYRMHQRAASSLRAGRVLLAGDAAHSTNPTGGLGLTSGLFDIETLGEALPAVIKAEVSDEVLDRYSARRRAAFLDIASPAASQFKQLVFGTSDEKVFDAFFADIHQVAADPERMRAQFLAFGESRTGSVLDPSAERAQS